MRSRQTPTASIDHGYQHMVMVTLTRQALYAGRRLRYDARRERIV